MVRLPVLHKKINDELKGKRGLPYIYFLISENRIIYIGQTQNIEARLVNHKSYFKFDQFAFMPVDATLLNKYERRLIRLFKPEKNNCLYDKEPRIRKGKSSGRKPLYDVEALNPGDRLEIKSKMGKFAHQIAYSCSRRYNGLRKFSAKFEGGHVYIIREI